jgi:flagellar basal-body rod protein FlgC
MSEGINNIFRTSEIAASGLRADRLWMNSISNNIANMNTLDTGVRGKDGNFVPYAREVPLFAQVLSEKFRGNKVNGDVKDGVMVKDMAQRIPRLARREALMLGMFITLISA